MGAVVGGAVVGRELEGGMVADNSSHPRRPPKKKTRKKFFFPCTLPALNA
jgi:hypothetical protein